MGWGDAFNMGSEVGQQVERYAATGSREDYDQMVRETQRRLLVEGLEAPLIDWQQGAGSTEERRPTLAPPPAPQEEEGDNPLMRFLEMPQLPPRVYRPIYQPEPRHEAVKRTAALGMDRELFAARFGVRW